MIHLIENYNKEVSESEKLSFDDFKKVILLPETNDDKGYYIALNNDFDQELAKEIRSAFSKIDEKATLIEVAHWWTNEIEQEMLEVYKSALAKDGYQWFDYTLHGGAGINMPKILASREEINNRPHAFQTYMGPELYDWAEKGVLLNLNEVAMQEKWSEYLPSLINEGIKYKGNYVAVPVNMQRINLIWCNMKVFENSNVKLPSNWKEFDEALYKIKKAGYIPIALGGEAWQEGTLFENLVLGMGGKEFYKSLFIDMDSAVLNNPKMRKILKKFREMKNYIDDAYLNRSWTKTGELVANGEAAMFIMGDWAKGVFKSNNIPYGDEGYIAIVTPGTEKIFLNNTDVFAFPKVNTNSESGQRALAKIIMQAKSQEEFNILKGSIPARIGISINKFDEVSKQSLISISKDEIIPSFNFKQIGDVELRNKFMEIISGFFETGLPIDITIERLKEIYPE